jgi:hypothetical protein
MSKSEINAIALQICPEECLYNYTPAGVVKTFDVSAAGKEKVAKLLHQQLKTVELKRHAKDFIENVKDKYR